jgi:hypothetical protein
MYKLLVSLIICSLLASCQNSGSKGNDITSIKPHYLIDFEKKMTKIPEDFFVMDGDFRVKKLGSTTGLYLRPFPLSTYSMLFGPEVKGSTLVSADVYGSQSGRTFPSFGIGSHGISGLQLLLTQNRKGAQLTLIYNEKQILDVAPCDWQTDQWSRIQMKVIKTADGVEIFGRCWSLTGKNPTRNVRDKVMNLKGNSMRWSIHHKAKLKLDSGQASIWGIPYSGRDLFYDNLAIANP